MIRVRMGYGECVPTMLNLVVISGKVNLVIETEVSTPKKKTNLVQLGLLCCG